MNVLDTLILSLPTRDSTVRMRVWRTLKESGCAVLRDGVYVLPTGSARAAVLAEMASEVKSVGGFAMTAELRVANDEHRAQLCGLFDRSEEYGALVTAIGEARPSVRRLGRRKAQTMLQRLQRSFDRLAEIDFFPGQAKRQAEDALSSLAQDFRQAYSSGEPHPSGKQVRPVNAAR